MKQIITQHGWGLNKYFWDDYKVDFLKNNWHWQDNETVSYTHLTLPTSRSV